MLFTEVTGLQSHDHSRNIAHLENLEERSIVLFCGLMQEVCSLGSNLWIRGLVELLLEIGFVLKHLDEVSKDSPSRQQCLLVDLLERGALVKEEILLLLGHLLVAVGLRIRRIADHVLEKGISNSKQVIGNEEVRDPLLNRLIDALRVCLAH